MMSNRPHVWAKSPYDPWMFCMYCGNIKRADGLNKPCRGISRVQLRRTGAQDTEGK